MSLDIFRKKLREYYHLAGRSQQQLADEIGMHLTTLSRKLNQSGTARLTNTEVKQIVKVLAEWGGVNTQPEAVELLELVGLNRNTFSEQEWHTAPLNLLEAGNPPAKPPIKPVIKLSPVENSGTVLKEVTPANTASQVFNLPFTVTSFVGREKELAEISDLVKQPHIPLITLTGPGGVGKTRLALQVISQLKADFEDGVCFVSLGTLHDPGLVAPAIVQALGGKEAIAKKTASQTLTFLKDYLRHKQLLLLIDNFEQLSDAAPLLTDLIAEAPGLKILVTSRAVLRLYGEYEYALPPLSLPDLKQTAPALLAQNDSINLFLQRARAVKQEFGLNSANGPLLAEICIRLDGLPLAIELAAARTKLLSPQMLLDRLNRRLALLTGGAADLPVRHQTLRNAIDWSYDLLERNDKRLFRHFAVFEGGCSLEAAETVLEQAGYDLLEGISSLLDKSMLRQIEEQDGQPRYLMLGTIREYGLEQLVENGEEVSLRQQHAAFFLDLAEQAAPALEGPQQVNWLDRLESEHNNFLAVLDWALAALKQEASPPQPLFNRSNRSPSHLNARYLHPGEIALRMGSALWRFWWLRGYLSDGRQRLEATLATFQPRPAEEEQSWFNEIRVKALHTAGTLAYYQGDFDGAVAFFQESLSLGHALKSKPIIAKALQDLGMVGVQRGDFQSAREQYLQSMVLHQELQNKAGTAASLLKLAGEEVRLGNFAHAQTHYEESLSLGYEVGDKSSIASTISKQGELAASQGNFSHARHLFEQSLSISQELRDRPGIATLLNNLGVLATKTGAYPEARALLEESLSLKERQGDRSGLAVALGNLGNVATNQGLFEEAAKYLERGVALKRELGEWPSLNISLNGLAYLAILSGRYDRARALLTESLEFGQKFGDKLALTDTYIMLGLLELRQANFAEAGKNLLKALTITQGVGASHLMAICLTWLVKLAEQTGWFEQGVNLVGAVEALLKATGGVLEPYQQTEYEQALAALRLQVNEAVFMNLLTEGQAMSPAQLVEFCQSWLPET